MELPFLKKKRNKLGPSTADKKDDKSFSITIPGSMILGKNSHEKIAEFVRKEIAKRGFKVNLKDLKKSKHEG